MGLTDLLFKKQKAQIGTRFPTPEFPLPALVEFDASVSEAHNDEVEVTEHPVEDGSDVADHIRKLPNVITIEGLITNTPIIFLASIQAESPVIGDLKPTHDRVETGYAKLREFQDAGILVDVITSLRQYTDMVLLTVGVQRDTLNGNVLNCIMTLRKLKKAKALTVDLPTPEDVANNAAQNAGQQSSSPASAGQAAKSQSILASIFSLFGV
jgi:hypothetical protein